MTTDKPTHRLRSKQALMGKPPDAPHVIAAAFHPQAPARLPCNITICDSDQERHDPSPLLASITSSRTGALAYYVPPPDVIADHAPRKPKSRLAAPFRYPETKSVGSVFPAADSHCSYPGVSGLAHMLTMSLPHLSPLLPTRLPGYPKPNPCRHSPKRKPRRRHLLYWPASLQRSRLSPLLRVAMASAKSACLLHAGYSTTCLLHRPSASKVLPSA